MAAIFHWPARRPNPAHNTEHSSDDDGFLPGTFEPEEQLGDTGPAPLDPIQRAKEDTSLPRWAWWLVGAVMVAAAFWPAA